jgi:hypothetical protein
MTKMEKCVAGLGVCISGLLVFAIGAFNGAGGTAPKTTAQSASAPRPATSLQNQSPGFGQGQAQSDPKTASRAVPTQIDPLPANATFIPDGNLQQLSMMVNLASAVNQQPDKTRWTEAVTVAQKLLNGPCDCAQRVWLKHFVEMGNYALSDSTDQYRDTAKLMATLGRNDTEAMALSRKAN